MTQNTDSTAGLPSIVLYFQEEGSDKEYHARVEKDGEGYIVKTSWGRRGTTLQHGQKPNKPVDLAKALKEYHKIVTEKKAKGYTEGESGQRFSGTHEEGRVSPYLPQLLNPIEVAEAGRFIMGDWWMEEKKDGHRRLVEKLGTQVRGINRRGLYVPLPDGVATYLRAAPGDFVLDGELIGQRFYVFDLLVYGTDIRSLTLAQRHASLDQLFSLLGESDCVFRLHTAKSPRTKQDHYDTMRDADREGVVFKDPTAPYTAGRPNAGGSARKLKFTATASVMVIAPNGGKRSVLMGLYNAQGTLVEVGNVTIPPNRRVPIGDTVIEVGYLYANPNGALYQPVFRDVRDDIPPQQCTMDQLKLKPQENDEDA